jgi:hypothetical protein
MHRADREFAQGDLNLVAEFDGRNTGPFDSGPGAVDVGSDALVRAGIADVVRRPIASAELAAALSRSLRSAARLPM